MLYVALDIIFIAVCVIIMCIQYEGGSWHLFVALIVGPGMLDLGMLWIFVSFEL